MKKLFILLALLTATACAAPSTEPDDPSPVATAIEPLQEATPSTTIPSPSPTPAATSKATLVPDDVTEETQEESGQPVIIFHQEGGFAGVDLTWTIYDNGLIVTPDGEELSVDPAAVDELLAAIDQAGFFELAQTKPSSVCCDFFTYTIAVAYGDKKNVITYNDGDPDKPAGLAEVVSAVQQMIPQ